MDWNYFTAANGDGTVRLIVRRRGAEIQLLTPEGWIDRPQLLPRFQDADFLDEVSGVQAQHAAVGVGLAWPS